MNKQYTYQEFLLHCPYQDILLEDYIFPTLEELQEIDTEYNLFDYSAGLIRRSVALSKLDRIVDEEGDLDQFIADASWIAELVIINDRPNFDNTILAAYSNNTVKAYLYRINAAGIRCFIG